ncbi:MAG TPA: sigma-70 family RNA polymerase sigma factor [Solirubrobacteraceae bacterium]|nr:sigma-70 family RNA polymerase sigma factor [Solirubrobacteraceae bacterium]
MGDGGTRTVGGRRMRSGLRRRPGRSPASGTEEQEFVVELVRRESAAMLRVADRYSYCADDAAEAYGRALEILMRRARSLDPERAGGWLATVVKHEALKVRQQRQREVACDAAGFDREEARGAPGPEERVAGFEVVARSAEALRALKPQEVAALWLRMQGLSYEEIAERQGWTATKVNRCLTEGRRAFLERFAGIEAGEECRRWEPVLTALADGEAGAGKLVDVRAHLRNCAACRRRLEAIYGARAPLGLLFPVALTGAAVDPSELAGGLLLRAYEAVAGGVHDRAVHSALRVQAALEMASASKVAAVAASAAALAGSGVAAVEKTNGGASQHEAAVAVARPPAASPRRGEMGSPGGAPVAVRVRAPTGAQPVKVVSGGRDLVSRARGRHRAPDRRAAQRPTAERRPYEFGGSAEFAGSSGAASPSSAGGGEFTRSSTTTSALRSGRGEFASTPPPPATTATSPSPPSSRSSGGSSAGGEFSGGEFGP